MKWLVEALEIEDSSVAEILEHIEEDDNYTDTVKKWSSGKTNPEKRAFFQGVIFHVMMDANEKNIMDEDTGRLLAKNEMFR